MSVTTIPHHLSLEERRAIGRAARERLPRKEAGDWTSDGRGHDALRTVLTQNAVRAPDLVPIRHSRMAASPWTYYRGAAAVMAADLASRPESGLTVQLCGDAHVLNFGLWATPERQLSFDLRDFDETLPGPFEWDVMRMAASLQVLARDAGLTKTREADRAVRARSTGTAAGSRGTPGPVPRRLVRPDHGRGSAQRRRGRGAGGHCGEAPRASEEALNVGAAKKFTEVVDGRVRLVEAPPFRVRDDRAGRAIVDEVRAAYRVSLPEERRYLIDRYSLVDEIRQVVGVGSVGMRVYLLLLEGARPDDLLFLQVKQRDRRCTRRSWSPVATRTMASE